MGKANNPRRRDQESPLDVRRVLINLLFLWVAVVAMAWAADRIRPFLELPRMVVLAQGGAAAAAFLWFLFDKELKALAWQGLKSRRATRPLACVAGSCVLAAALAHWSTFALGRQPFLVVMPHYGVSDLLVPGRFELILQREGSALEPFRINEPKLVWVGSRYFLWAWRNQHRDAIHREVEEVLKAWNPEDADVATDIEQMWQGPTFPVGNLRAGENVSFALRCSRANKRISEWWHASPGSDLLVVLDATEPLPNCP